jgi:hypothetical protein
MKHARKTIVKRSARKRGWNDMSPREQTGVLIAGSVQISLAATAWADLAKRPSTLVNGSKLLWAAVIAVNFVGPIAYFVCGRRKLPARATPESGVPVAGPVVTGVAAVADPEASAAPEATSVPPVVDEGEPGTMPGLA